MIEPGPAYAPVPLISTALACRCPRCGKGRLYDGLLEVRSSCGVCGLDLASNDAGDGAAAFVILILGGAVTFLALTLHVLAHPPVWVHLAVWIPVSLIGTILMLRVVKAALIIQQYKVSRPSDDDAAGG